MGKHEHIIVRLTYHLSLFDKKKIKINLLCCRGKVDKFLEKQQEGHPVVQLLNLKLLFDITSVLEVHYVIDIYCIFRRTSSHVNSENSDKIR